MTLLEKIVFILLHPVFIDDLNNIVLSLFGVELEAGQAVLILKD